MLTNPSWLDVALRLGLAAVAGMLVGYNREARSQAAGLRTTTLVCVSACLSMVLANLLLTMTGGNVDGYARFDVMRLPLGVLTGIGFIGAGAIVRRDDAVIGVATAATLWFMTLVGLTIGAGELALGAAVTVVGLLMLGGLEWADRHIRRRFRAFLRINAEPGRLSEEEARQIIEESGQRVVAWAVTYRDGGESYEARAELEWHGQTRDRAQPPSFLQALAVRPGVRQVDWSPQTLSL
jgi:putative Mg2+ transporter-C (MgtC) family protein